MREWLVAADDRTGAFEVAALLAEIVGPVDVSAGALPVGAGVVDLGSRELSASAATSAAEVVDVASAGWIAHKIDSTLRGNWAAELLARRRVSGRRIVVLPGWPELGRTCVAGVVQVHGEPIGSALEGLPGATSIADAEALARWLAGDGAIAVCDVPDTGTMHALAQALVDADVLVAGPAGPIGAVFAARFGPPRSPGRQTIHGPVLVVCGSANPVALAQMQRLSLALPTVRIVTAPPAGGALKVAVAGQIAAQAHRIARELMPATVIVVGGDTAAAFLGSAPRLVGGTVAAGMPWSLDAAGQGPLVITKAGGFGGPDALVDLLMSETG